MVVFIRCFALWPRVRPLFCPYYICGRLFGNIKKRILLIWLLTFCLHAEDGQRQCYGARSDKMAAVYGGAFRQLDVWPLLLDRVDKTVLPVRPHLDAFLDAFQVLPPPVGGLDELPPDLEPQHTPSDSAEFVLNGPLRPGGVIVGLARAKAWWDSDEA